MDEQDLDRDILIQRASADLLADFDRSLGPFLRKPNGQLRARVRDREASRLISQVLEPFQELPQLLDPHLPKFVPALADAYLEHIQDRRRTKSLSLRSHLLIPLSQAISRIIYTFCKIRGEKVIVRFLSVETKYLELLLHAIEESERQSQELAGDQPPVNSWTWHERYVVLLWLSQLFFAPFDLSTISSGEVDDADRPNIPGFQWPSQIPSITLRVVPLALKYLALPGKERDGAKALLVRLAMRRDMQELGILHALVQWALYTLRPTGNDAAKSAYYYIGSLSLLAGILRSSADTSIMDKYLTSIFHAVQAVSSEDNAVFKAINGSALARKTMIKVTRSVITLVLRKPEQSMEETEMTETSIGYLLESLSDNDTPVRFSASKALSMITLKLESDMALQVVEAVLESLNRNVLWVKSPSLDSDAKTRDLAAVDPLEWHGLMLTLSHLLYRRSPPPESLSDIIRALIMGLSFEKRGAAGGSIGTNVRDAACFGIWALARRYTTKELLQVPALPSKSIAKEETPTSILQTIATELVVAASLDPAGNIRRGSSAALQELIGRHPDTIKEGISVVQAVDYHAVALRSRAIHSVSLQATRLSPQYGLGILEALLGWRGMADMDAAARRVAAVAFGTLTAEIGRVASNPLLYFNQSVDLLLNRINGLQVRQVEERHGLLLSLAAVFDSLPQLAKERLTDDLVNDLPICKSLDALSAILKDSIETNYRKPELVAEAVSTLAVSAYPILLLHSVSQTATAAELRDFLKAGAILTSEVEPDLVLKALTAVDTARANDSPNLEKIITELSNAMDRWLNRDEVEVTRPTAQASVLLLLFSGQEDRLSEIRKWISQIRVSGGSPPKHGIGYFYALTQVYRVVTFLPDGPSILAEIIAALRDRWAADHEVETHVAILQSLIDKDMLRHQTADFVPMISNGLDNYITTRRGDIGSHVRLAAIRATKTIWKFIVRGSGSDETRGDVLALYSKILRLAAEKLDRVRTEAQATVTLVLTDSYATALHGLSFSSQEYFVQLLGMCNADRLHAAIADAWGLSETECTSCLLAGLATSADTGNEDLVIASRAAIAKICRSSADDLTKICMALIHNLKLYQGQDRVVVPTLELIAYLSHVGLFQQCKDINLRQLCLLTQKAGYKTGNMRKIEACIKVYGGVASAKVDTEVAADAASELELKRQEGSAEARRRLGALLSHPWPKVRSMVIDELWGLLSGKQPEQARELLSVDWGQAEKTKVKTLLGVLDLN